MTSLIDWQLVPLHQLVEPQRAQVKAADLPEDEPYTGLEHVASRTGVYRPTTVGAAQLKSAKFRYQTGNILYGKLRPGLRKCVVALEEGVCSTDLLPLKPLVPSTGALIAAQLRSEWFSGRVTSLISGANLPRVSVRDLMSTSLPMPPKDQLNRLIEMAQIVDAARYAADEVNRLLEEAQRSLESHLMGYSSVASSTSPPSARSMKSL